MFKATFAGLLVAVLATITPACAQAPGSAPRHITLEQAIALALEGSSRLTSAEAAIGASHGEQRQAGALPNPQLGIEAENFGGQGDYRGFETAEVTYGVSQLIEIGGKRSARQSAADHAHAASHAEYQSIKRDLIRDVTIAYAEAVAAKESVALAERQRALAAEVLSNVAQRVSAAAEPLFQRSKAEVALATSEMALDKAKRDDTIARKQLAALWDSEDPTFDLDSSRYFEAAPPKAPSRGTSHNAALARLASEVERSRALYDLEEANAIPDPTVTGGVKAFEATGDKAFVVGLSIPIPVFNQNRGNIAKARSEVTRAASQKRLAEVALSAELVKSQQELENAYRQADSLKSTVIPAAEKAYALSRQGYSTGKFPYLEVLDAQRTLVDARSQYNETLKTYHVKRAEVERLSATFEPIAEEEDDAHAY
jgi:cobalt-zinc-cadmium efflux system outer membrane protein